MGLDFFYKVAKIYSLGEVLATELLANGIDDQNFKITTTTGCYVVKIFSENKTFANISDNIKCLQEFNLHQIPVPNLIKLSSGDYLTLVKWGEEEKRICVTEFFEAPSLADIDLTREHISDVVKYMVLIHNLSINLAPNYDSWGTTNLKTEFDLKQKHLQKDDWKLVKPVVDAFESISFADFNRSIIHGDLRKDHVLILRQKYMILDLGCVDYNYSIVDFAIFNAFFCFDSKDNSSSPNRLVSIALNDYTRSKSFSEAEVKVLDTLIKSTWAAFLVASSSIFYAPKNSHPRISFWLNYSRRLLNKFKDFSLRI